MEALGKELLKFVQGKSYRFASPHDNYSIGGVVGFRVNNLADRQHTNDNLQSLSQIKKQEFMFSVTILYVELDSDNHGVVPFKKGQEAYWSVALDYNNSKFYGINNMSLWDHSIKYSMNFGPMSQTLRGKIFGELEGVLDLERKYIPQPGEVIHEDVDATDGGVGHRGMAYLYDQLKSFGFKLDEKQLFGGTPTLYKGDDNNGVFIQFYQDNGFYFQLAVTKNNKTVLFKKYPLKESENYTSDNAVKLILRDVEGFKNMKIVNTHFNDTQVNEVGMVTAAKPAVAPKVTGVKPEPRPMS
jgi:hypothetical protein